MEFPPRQGFIVDVKVSLVDGAHPLPRLPSSIFRGVKRVAGVDVELFEGGGEEEAVGMQVHPGWEDVPESTSMNHTCTSRVYEHFHMLNMAVTRSLFQLMLDAKLYPTFSHCR